jgi:hypothetical protein
LEVVLKSETRLFVDRRVGESLEDLLQGGLTDGVFGHAVVGFVLFNEAEDLADGLA